MQQDIVCMCICCVPSREVGRLATVASRPTSLQGLKYIQIHTISCRITDKYNRNMTDFLLLALSSAKSVH